MKISGKLTTALLIASMTFGFVGCKGEPPEPPREVGQADVLNKVEVSVSSFEVTTPDFLDGSNRAARPSEGQDKVAILRLKIKNGSGEEKQYKPLHLEGAKNRVQLCTDPDPETGARQNVKAIKFDAANNYHTPGQHIENVVKIAPGSEIYDEYLFEPPVTNEQLVVLVPGTIIGETKIMRFKVNKPVEVAAKPPTQQGQTANLDGLEVKVTKVIQEYAELATVNPPKKPLKYPYAYTEKPVLAIYVSLTNNSSEGKSYDPSHGTDVVGINLFFEKTSQQKRVKLGNGVKGKNQVNGKISIEPGRTITDVYYFEPPSSSGKLEFDLSGHICGVRGIYRFDLTYTKSDPSAPDLEPYKSSGKPEDAVEESAEEEEEAADTAADAADAGEEKGEEKAE
ncbi:MAG: hypothetical protein J6A01_08895 [Proteobacteria bacterium]|nr:hypothetical protein [Pseudomonadota bacterium]